MAAILAKIAEIFRIFEMVMQGVRAEMSGQGAPKREAKYGFGPSEFLAASLADALGRFRPSKKYFLKILKM